MFDIIKWEIFHSTVMAEVPKQYFELSIAVAENCWLTFPLVFIKILQQT
jgi:hypothetical protein